MAFVPKATFLAWGALLCDNTVSLLWSSSWLELLNIWGNNLSSSLRLLLGMGVTWSMMLKVVRASRDTGFLNAGNVKFKGFLPQCTFLKHRQDAWSYRGHLWPWSQREQKLCRIILRQTFWEQTQHLPSVDFCYVEKMDTSWSHPKLSFQSLQPNSIFLEHPGRKGLALWDFNSYPSCCLFPANETWLLK